MLRLPPPQRQLPVVPLMLLVMSPLRALLPNLPLLPKPVSPGLTNQAQLPRPALVS